MIGLHFFLGISFAILITFILLDSDKDNFNAFKKVYIKRLLTDPYYTLVTFCTFAFSIYIFTLESDSENIHKLQKATRDALVAYIIALFAFFNLTLLPYWIIWFITYYSVL